MYKLSIISLFSMQFTFGQSQIQHEPERIFNSLKKGIATTEYAKEKKLKKITFYRDTTLSSLMEFDENGNFIRTVEMENNYVRHSTYKWDEQNRMIEKKHFSPDGTFSYGYYYLYENGANLMFKLKDSVLFEKNTFLKGENISIYSRYDSIGKVTTKSVSVKDDDMKWLMETRFQDNQIYLQYRYEYIDNKKYITKIQFDNNGTKFSENRHLDEVKLKGKLEHYTDDGWLFRVDNFDENDNLIKMELFEEDGQMTRKECSKYDSNGKLVKQTKNFLKRDYKIVYTFKYDEMNRIRKVIKKLDGNKEIFRYAYDVY
ncbi:hypothetical protein [Flagellimonas sp.]